MVLQRASEVKARCTALMQDPYCMMTATVELLETISSLEENAFHRLFGWCQAECHNTGDKNYCLDEGNSSFLRLRRGLLTLRQKESYFNHCLTDFVNNRRNLLASLLADNLLQWSQNRSEENPNQMMSDLFTWLHEYMNEERAGIRVLLADEAKESSASSSSSSSSSQNHFVNSCMDVIFSGANKFVQEYLNPYFDENSNVLQLFESLQILAFYDNIVSNIISKDCSLRSTLLSIEQTLWTRITNLFVVRVKHYFKLSPFVSNSFITAGNGVSTKNGSERGQNTIFTELLLLLRQCFDMFCLLLHVRCSLNNTTMEIERKTELFNSLVEASLMPLVENSRDYFQIMDTTELYVTLVNVIEELKSVVSQYGFGVNFNYYLCEKSDFYTDTIIREKVRES